MTIMAVQWKNRASLLLDILKNFPGKSSAKGRILGLRLCGDEYAPWGGLAPEDWAKKSPNISQIK